MVFITATTEQQVIVGWKYHNGTGRNSKGKKETATERQQFIITTIRTKKIITSIHLKEV